MISNTESMSLQSSYSDLFLGWNYHAFEQNWRLLHEGRIFLWKVMHSKNPFIFYLSGSLMRVILIASVIPMNSKRDATRKLPLNIFILMKVKWVVRKYRPET